VLRCTRIIALPLVAQVLRYVRCTFRCRHSATNRRIVSLSPPTVTCFVPESVPASSARHTVRPFRWPRTSPYSLSNRCDSLPANSRCNSACFFALPLRPTSHLGPSSIHASVRRFSPWKSTVACQDHPRSRVLGIFPLKNSSNSPRPPTTFRPREVLVRKQFRWRACFNTAWKKASAMHRRANARVLCENGHSQMGHPCFNPTNHRNSRLYPTVP